MRHSDRLPLEPKYIVERTAAVDAPAVSIVLPSFNRSKVLQQAIDSVLALDEVQFEVIVVDDGSTDATISELKRIRDPRVGIVRLIGNRGANVARNMGISLSRAPYVGFLDSDDTYLPGRLALPLSVLQRHANVGVVLSTFTAQKSSKTTVCSMPERLFLGQDLTRLVARGVILPTTSGLTVRRDLLCAVGGFDPGLSRLQDSDLVMRLARRTMAATIAKPLWHKRWQEDGISSSRKTYLPALLALIERHDLYNGEELDTRDYLFARHFLALAKSLHLRQLHSDYCVAAAELSTPLPALPSLLAGYLSSRRRRRRLRRSLLSGRHVAEVSEASACTVVL